MSYPERTSSSKRQRRIISASVSWISSNWAAVTAPPSSSTTTGSQLSVIGPQPRPLEVQSRRSEGPASQGERPSFELRPPPTCREGAPVGSDSGQLVDAGALRLVLAVGSPGKEQDPAGHDDECGSGADAEPDRVEDQDREKPDEKDRDSDARELQPVTGHGA